MATLGSDPNLQKHVLKNRRTAISLFRVTSSALARALFLALQVKIKRL